LFLVSDARVAAGEPPHGLVVAWIADGIDLSEDSDLDLVEQVAEYVYDSTAPRP
jgi:hypothetical protein